MEYLLPNCSVFCVVNCEALLALTHSNHTTIHVSYIQFNIILLHDFIFQLMLRHVSASAVGHLQGTRTGFDNCSLCFNLYDLNSTFMIKTIIMNIKYHNS